MKRSFCASESALTSKTVVCDGSPSVSCLKTPTRSRGASCRKLKLGVRPTPNNGRQSDPKLRCGDVPQPAKSTNSHQSSGSSVTPVGVRGCQNLRQSFKWASDDAGKCSKPASVPHSPSSISSPQPARFVNTMTPVKPTDAGDCQPVPDGDGAVCYWSRTATTLQPREKVIGQQSGFWLKTSTPRTSCLSSACGGELTPSDYGTSSDSKPQASFVSPPKRNVARESVHCSETSESQGIAKWTPKYAPKFLSAESNSTQASFINPPKINVSKESETSESQTGGEWMPKYAPRFVTSESNSTPNHIKQTGDIDQQPVSSSWVKPPVYRPSYEPPVYRPSFLKSGLASHLSGNCPNTVPSPEHCTPGSNVDREFASCSMPASPVSSPSYRSAEPMCKSADGGLNTRTAAVLNPPKGISSWRAKGIAIQAIYYNVCGQRMDAVSATWKDHKFALSSDSIDSSNATSESDAVAKLISQQLKKKKKKKRNLEKKQAMTVPKLSQQVKNDQFKEKRRREVDQVKKPAVFVRKFTPSSADSPRRSQPAAEVAEEEMDIADAVSEVLLAITITITNTAKMCIEPPRVLYCSVSQTGKS